MPSPATPAAGSAAGAALPFTDIAGTPFVDEIVWLADMGITTGCAPSLFCPDATRSRAVRWRRSWPARWTCRRPRPTTSLTTTAPPTRTTSTASRRPASPPAAATPTSAPTDPVTRAAAGQLPGARPGPGGDQHRLLHRRRRQCPRGRDQPHRRRRHHHRLRARPLLPQRHRHPPGAGRLLLSRIRSLKAPDPSVLFRTRPHRHRLPAHVDPASLIACRPADLRLDRDVDLTCGCDRLRRSHRRPRRMPSPDMSSPTVHAEMLAEHADDAVDSRRAACPHPMANAGRPVEQRAPPAGRRSIAGLPNGLRREVFGYLPYWTRRRRPDGEPRLRPRFDDRVLLGWCAGERDARQDVQRSADHRLGGLELGRHDGCHLRGTCARRQGRPDRHDDGLGRRLRAT